MAKKKVKLVVPFESLVQSIAELSFEDKRRIWALLEGELAHLEEETWEQDPTVRAEIQEARAAYDTGDYLTIDEYIAGKSENA